MKKAFRYILMAGFAVWPMAAAAQMDPMPTPDEATIFAEAEDDHVLGADDAPITMIVYASVTCSHCGEWFSKEWPKVKSDLVETGKVRFVMRELPTAPVQLSMLGFIMAECAPEDRYFEVIEYQMREQAHIFAQAKAGKAKAEYDKIAKMAGLEDEAAIQACFNEPANMEHIAMSQIRAQKAGVEGVPAFYINGAAYGGAQDADSLLELIELMEASGITELPKSHLKSAKDGHEGHNH